MFITQIRTYVDVGTPRKVLVRQYASEYIKVRPSTSIYVDVRRGTSGKVGKRRGGVIYEAGRRSFIVLLVHGHQIHQAAEIRIIFLIHLKQG